MESHSLAELVHDIAQGAYHARTYAHKAHKEIPSDTFQSRVETRAQLAPVTGQEVASATESLSACGHFLPGQQAISMAQTLYALSRKARTVR